MCRYILLISTFYNILHSTRPFKDYFKWIDRTGFSYQAVKIIYLSICLSIYVCVYVFIYLSIYLYTLYVIYLSTCIYLFIHSCIHILFVYVFIYLYIYLYVYLCIELHVCLLYSFIIQFLFIHLMCVCVCERVFFLSSIGLSQCKYVRAESIDICFLSNASYIQCQNPKSLKNYDSYESLRYMWNGV